MYDNSAINHFWRRGGILASTLAIALLWLFISIPAYAESLRAERLAIFLPEYTSLSTPTGDYQVQTVLQEDEVIGYLFETIHVINIPAYSGKPINMQIILAPNGHILDAYVKEHHEPILLIGIPEQRLHDFNDKYQGVHVEQRVVVGHSKDPNAITVDAVSGATVTVMVINEVIMRATQRVAVSLGLVADTQRLQQPPATVKVDFYQSSNWAVLLGEGSIRRLLISKGQVDQAFVGTEGEYIDNASAEEIDETFIDLYVAHLNPATIGRTLLGDNTYRFLMRDLQPNEHAIAVMANGEYSFKGNGYVRGGIFDRVQLRQFGDTISFRDMDQERIYDIVAADAPSFSEQSIFIIRDQYAFDPGSDWSLELLIRRQTGPVDSVFSSMELLYQTPEYLLDRPEPTAAELAAQAEANRPLWLNIWYQKQFQISVLLIALALLLVIMFLQDLLTRRPTLMHWIRRGYLVFTVFFIGWYAMGQLSIVNVLTFAQAIIHDFHWQLFLMDPVIFILWTFTAATILLWGRGVFCGWLCPFGALQELLNEMARKINIPQYELPFAVHERLWAVKYLILLALFAISLESLATAEQYAEVEPFKTAITMTFMREWGFVLYAVLLLVINLFTRKVYCRYICPLGAALAVPSKFRLFAWLKRRKECGQPCQLCANECEIQAIHPNGEINYNECHYCLDCQMTYHNEHKCPPLVAKNKKRQRNKAVPDRIPAVQLDPQTH
ncbi:MAG: regulatory protein NosR [Bacterioplanes sp.]|nr:regulatory protein NosR [Bacterioplanes sp.]